jgi:hypothetical protein
MMPTHMSRYDDSVFGARGIIEDSSGGERRFLTRPDDLARGGKEIAKYKSCQLVCDFSNQPLKQAFAPLY